MKLVACVVVLGAALDFVVPSAARLALVSLAGLAFVGAGLLVPLFPR